MVVSTVYKVAERSTECVAFACIVAVVNFTPYRCSEKWNSRCCSGHQRATNISFTVVGSQIASSMHSSSVDAFSKMNQEGYSVRDIGLERLFVRLINCQNHSVIGVFSKHQGSPENRERGTDQDSTFASTMVSAFDTNHQATREYMAITTVGGSAFKVVSATGKVHKSQDFIDAVAKYEELGYQNTRLGIEKILATLKLIDGQTILQVVTKDIEDDLSD